MNISFTKHLPHLLYKVSVGVAVGAIDLVHCVVDGAPENSDEEPVMFQHVAALIELPLPVEGEDTWGFICNIRLLSSALCCFCLLLNAVDITDTLCTLRVSVPGIEDHVVLLCYPGQMAGQLVVYCGVDRFLE